MTGTSSKNGVIELFPTGLAERPGDDEGSLEGLEAIGLIQRKLRAQIGLIAMARKGHQELSELHESLAEIKDLTSSIIDDLDRVIPTLADRSDESLAEHAQVELFTRLTQLCAGFRASSGIACVLAALPRHLQVDEPAGDILFRAVRELLTNVRRHSHAKRVEITTDVRPDGSVTLAVKDDGIGMPPGERRLSALESGAIGLSSIDLRLREIDAYMEIESMGGVCARIVLPAHIFAAGGGQLART